MKKLIILFLLFTSCVSSKPSWEYKKAPDNLFDAVNVKDNNPKRNKGIMKTLVFSTAVFILTTIAEK